MMYRTLAERLVGATNDDRIRSVEAVAIAEALITAHFKARDAAARRLVREAEAAAEYLFDHCGDTDDVRKIASSLRTAADALAALLPEEPR